MDGTSPSPLTSPRFPSRLTSAVLPEGSALACIAGEANPLLEATPNGNRSNVKGKIFGPTHIIKVKRSHFVHHVDAPRTYAVIVKIHPSKAISRGPFSAVRSPEVAHAPQGDSGVNSSPPVDVMETSKSTGQTPQESAPPLSGMSMAGMKEHGSRSAGAALAAFPQIVHILADPSLHLGRRLADLVDLPLVSVSENSPEKLLHLLSQPEFSHGFILEGSPANRLGAEQLDALFSATSVDNHRVLGLEFQGQAPTEVTDHYIDQGLMWQVPSSSDVNRPDQIQKSMMECLVGLPVLE